MTMPLDWQNSRKWKYKQNVPVPEGKVGAPRASRIAKSDADKGRTGAGSHAEWRQRRQLSTGTGDTNLCYGKYLAWAPGDTVWHWARLVPERAAQTS